MITLIVKGMTCQGCVRSVKSALEGVNSAASVDIDLDSGKVEIAADGPPDAFVTAIEDAGFEVVG